MVDLESVEHLVSNEFAFKHTLYKFNTLAELKEIIASTDDNELRTADKISTQYLFGMLNVQQFNPKLQSLLVIDVYNTDNECIKTKFMIV